MDTKQRKTVMIRVGAGLVVALVLAFLGWYLFWPSSNTAPKASPLGPSDQMIPQPPKAVAPPAAGSVVINPSNIEFIKDKGDTVVFLISAQGGPVTIKDITLPTADTDALKISIIDCQAAPAQLLPGTSCSASVTLTGTRTVNSTISVVTSSRDAQGQSSDKTQSIAVSGVSSNPNQAQPGATPTPGTVPPPATTGAANPAPTQTQVASGPSPMQQARESYLQGRRGAPIQIATSQLQPAARSPYTSWDNIGVQGSKSSFPVDMSRVITPDKPITAVLTYQIDTRATVTAVAMVDRDVYGSSGRTVVIPRGTKIIGKVGGGATDRVGIAWNQIIRPDGVRFVFDGQSGDAMGRGGVAGRINNRYLERYGFSLLPNLAGAGITALLGGQTSQNNGANGTSQTQDAKAVAAQILQQPLTQIAQDIYSKKSAIPVQITIPAGTRLTIWSTGDLRLKPVGEDDEPREGNGQSAQQNGQTSAFGAQRAGQTSAYGGYGGNQSAPQQGQAQPQGGVAGGGDGGTADGTSAALQVGRVDANGNYIAPGATAPAPGPLVTNTNNGAARVGQTTTPTNGQTNFPANRNPWQ